MNMQEDKSIIEVSHVSKYFGEKTALDDVTLNVKKGEFVTILGPSGCGKTTLLRLIAGFQTASEGEIRISGKEITQTPPPQTPGEYGISEICPISAFECIRQHCFWLETEKDTETDHWEEGESCFKNGRYDGL